MDISRIGFNNRNLINFLVAILVIGGLFSALNMSKLEDPEIKVKMAMVVATYPGASAHQMELEVTDPLEKKIRSMGNIDNIESYSMNDIAILQVELESTVNDGDVEQFWDLLRRRVNDCAALLPEGVTTQVRDDFGDVYGMFYALTGDGVPEQLLGDYAELIKRELNDLDGVSRVDIYGKRAENINISLKQDRMSNMGVSPVEVLSTLNGQNKTNYTGYFDNGDYRLRVTVSDKFKTVDEIGKMIIQGHDNDQLRLRDIADIEEGTAESCRNELLYDGEHAIGILIAAQSGTDILKIGASVEKKLEELTETRLPAGVECNKIFYQPQRVSESLGTFIINLIESVAIVVVILMIFMGLKSGMIIGASLIITVLGSFLFLSAADGTMQRVSLASFVLAMGMLVDNAIVIVDGILVDLKAGKSRMEALTSIGKQTAMPLLGATLIAILAFLPIYMSPDTAGIYVRDLFIVLAVSLLLSWVLALLHVPLMADSMLKAEKSNNEGEDNDDMYTGKVYVILSRILNWNLKHRVTIVVSMVILLILSGIGYTQMRQGFFPDMVYDQLYMEYKLPEGNNYTKVKKDLAEIEAYLKTRKEVTRVTTSIGGTPGRYNLVRSIALPSLSYGELIIDFESPEALVDNLDNIQEELSKRYPDAYLKLKRYNLMFKKYPIEAQFLGPDPEVLHQLADSARHIMETTPEVCLITTNWEPMQPVLTVEYDQPAARALGLSRSDVSMSLLTATGGIPIGSFYDGSHAKTVYVKSTDTEGKALEDLGNTSIFSTIPSISGLLTKESLVKVKSGNVDKEEVIEKLLSTTPLRQVSNGINIEWEPTVIPRYNGQRSQRVQCSPAPGIETEKAWRAVAQKIEKIELPAGYSLNWQGEKVASTRSMKYLFKNFPLAIILMIAILIMLFKDYKKPTIIFCCIPFVIVGVVAVMLLTGKTFNFVAIVGTLGLIGMLIKNGIVLMDEIALQLSKGKEPVKALIESSQSRLRPVMMASLTTILGMIPLLPDSMFGSLAASIMGGLLFATFITLFFVPVLYALFFHIHNDGRE
ncbi:MAG: efflux RND transporter permease subunit [Bacteroidia bacterium]|nr:efflux RND transporter permease subunit [Bacteroidia bacterium]